MDRAPGREDVRLRAARWRRRLLVGSVVGFCAVWALVAGNAVAASGSSPARATTPNTSGFFGDGAGSSGGGAAASLAPQTSFGSGSQVPILHSRGS